MTARAPVLDPAVRYGSRVGEEALRVLGLMDREEASPTYGCCDRTYWAWKFVDFPGARFQEAVCALAFLYATPLEGHPYAGDPRLLEWVGAGLDCWSRLQHRDGSFDEAYPFERSLAATAFTAFYVSEAIGWLGDAVPAVRLAAVRAALERAGDWLARNDEPHGILSNHLAAAAAALQHAYRLTGLERFDGCAQRVLERILEHQSAEGWYEEYGGADPGYQSHGSLYLVRYWELTGDVALEASLRGAMRFLGHFAHPDGSFGGEYASRNTQTYYPAACEMFAAVDPSAAWVAETMRPSVESGAAAGIRSVDIYNYFPFLNNLAFAYRAAADPARAPVLPAEPSPGAGLVHFPEAGIVRVRRERYDAYIGTRKGGVVKVYDRAERRLAYSDCGYVGRTWRGGLVTSQHAAAGSVIEVGESEVRLEGVFSGIARPTMTPGRFLLFRVFGLSVGRVRGVARWLKRLLVTVLIHRRSPVALHFRRSIRFAETGVVVEDALEGPDAHRLASLSWTERFATIHMGSSRYFVPGELTPGAVGDTGRVPLDRLRSGVTLRRTVRLD